MGEGRDRGWEGGGGRVGGGRKEVQRQLVWVGGGEGQRWLAAAGSVHDHLIVRK